jgi:RNA polymerase sigma-70 factor (ECF subfamily)
MDGSDHELMRRCAQGDWSAFEALVRRWEGPVARVVSRLARDADVEDLTQEVFLRVLLARERYRADWAFSTWLYRIALNVARDARRRRPWHLLGNHEPPDGRVTPIEMMTQQELVRSIDQAIGSLPGKLREALVLRLYGELTFPEIARLIGRPASTAKSRVCKALDRLRHELKRRGIEDGHGSA